jgi:hypothetical protein
MNKQATTKLVRAGDYAADVEVELFDGEGWSPYLTPADAQKLDTVRAALKRGDIAAASSLGQVYRLQPIAKAS